MHTSKIGKLWQKQKIFTWLVEAVTTVDEGTATFWCCCTCDDWIWFICVWWSCVPCVGWWLADVTEAIAVGWVENNCVEFVEFTVFTTILLFDVAEMDCNHKVNLNYIVLQSLKNIRKRNVRTKIISKKYKQAIKHRYFEGYLHSLENLKKNSSYNPGCAVAKEYNYIEKSYMKISCFILLCKYTTFMCEGAKRTANIKKSYFWFSN